jgi:hypothetical protein
VTTRCPPFSLGAAGLLINQEAVGTDGKGECNGCWLTSIQKLEGWGWVRDGFHTTPAAEQSRPSRLRVCSIPEALQQRLEARECNCREVRAHSPPRLRQANGEAPHRTRRSCARFGILTLFYMPDGGEIVVKILDGVCFNLMLLQEGVEIPT